MVNTLPCIALVALGGTIASVPTESGGAVPTLDAAALVKAVPGLEAIAEVKVFSFRQMPGAHLAIADLIELAEFIRSLRRDGIDGVIITQGTDTIEETAFALDLQISGLMPVIVTGAMRGPNEPGADGPANILGAARVAVNKKAADAGVLVVMGDTVHSARWVRKLHTTKPSAFSSPMTGPVGWITEGAATIIWQPCSGAILQNLDPENAPSVALIPTWLGDDGRLVKLASEAGYGGLVIQALGGGHVNPAVADAIGNAAAHMPVIFASRTGSGEILRKTYGFVGSERDLIARGAVPAGSLDSVKARLLLELLLSRVGHTPTEAIVDFQSFTAA